MPDNLTLRAYEDADYAGLAALLNHAWPDTPCAPAEHMSRLAALLPEAQVLALVDGRVVGAILALPCRLAAFEAPPPMADLYDVERAADHARDADGLFALEVLVHPDAGGRGIGRRLHGWIDGVLARHGLRGFVGVSRMPGLRASGVAPERYLADVIAGARSDPSLSFNLAVGMVPVRLVPGWWPADEESLGYGAVVTRRLERP